MSNEKETVSASNVLAVLSGFAMYGVLVAGMGLAADSISDGKMSFVEGFVFGAVTAPMLGYLALIAGVIVKDKTH